MLGARKPAARRHHLNVLVLLLFAGCGPGPRFVMIEEIEVTNVDDEYTDSLELEVHLYEAAGGRHVGCAGQDSGLEDVDLSDTRYRPGAYFVGPGGRATTELDDLSGGPVRFVVTEDDRRPCPVEQDATYRAAPTIDNEDDLVGTSSTVEVAGIEAGTQISFGKVVRLSVRARSE